MGHDFSAALPAQWSDLVRAARNARAQAYAPYSSFPVGAAVLTAAGQIFVGCNVENASYGLTICAERSAACAAVAAGQREIAAICISLTGTPVPCGACRQFLNEFNPSMTVLLDSPHNPVATQPECVLLSALLPRGFDLEH